MTLDPNSKEDIDPSKSLSRELEKGQFNELQEKLDYRYINFLKMVIESSRHKMTKEYEVFRFLYDRFPYFSSCTFDCRELIRHNLSHEECFLKFPKQHHDGRTIYDWAMVPDERINVSAPCSVRSSNRPPYSYVIFDHMAIMS